MQHPGDPNGGAASNHPIVELKQYAQRSYKIENKASNHPIVELKHNRMLYRAASHSTSNHPIVELKLNISGYVSKIN